MTTYFEISANGSYIRIEIIEYSYQSSETYWDGNWVNSNVSVKAGAFSGSFNACLMTIDFENFKNELVKLYEKLNGIAVFQTIESQVGIKIIGDGIGNLNAECIVLDNAGYGNILEFEINFDQSHIPKILNQLDKITVEFPIVGKTK
ncbi:WapI family immunity protein [Flavobacterium pallidum]|nr:hypothetical protein [Flavobacterium pallidum]